MAVSVRIEDEAFSDVRYVELAEYAGLADFDHARSKMEHLWRQCTLECRYNLPVSVVRYYLGPSGVEAIIRARLGEQISDTEVRIRGTRGRVEWLAKLRANGRKGGRPPKNRKKPNGSGGSEPSGYEKNNLPAPVPVPVPTSVPTDLTKTPIVPKGSRKKPKPSDPTPHELAIAATVLKRLGSRNGIDYANSAHDVGLITARLREGISEYDLRAVVAYCAEEFNGGWANSDKMRGYLRPSTLFGPQKIHDYLDAARAYAKQLGPQPMTPDPSEVSA